MIVPLINIRWLSKMLRSMRSLDDVASVAEAQLLRKRSANP
jgi:hypothetical protein